MKVHGNIDLNLNMIKKFAVDVVTELPNDPVVGRLVFKEDVGQLFICTQTDPSALWVPLANKNLTYVHNQEIVSNMWNIVHELNTTDVFVQVYTPGGYSIIPNEIKIVDENTIIIEFSENMAGKAVIASLNDVAKVKKTSVEYNFSLTNNLTINHGLGYYPHVTVINLNKELVIPDKITYLSKNEIQLSFGELQIEGTVIIG